MNPHLLYALMAERQRELLKAVPDPKPQRRRDHVHVNAEHNQSPPPRTCGQHPVRDGSGAISTEGGHTEGTVISRTPTHTGSAVAPSRCCSEPLLLRAAVASSRCCSEPCEREAGVAGSVPHHRQRGHSPKRWPGVETGRRECDRRVECVRAIGNDEIALLTPPVRLGPLRLRHREFELEKRARSACNG
jgi:hypothetical protein